VWSGWRPYATYLIGVISSFLPAPSRVIGKRFALQSAIGAVAGTALGVGIVVGECIVGR
jgi:hypothetical protein